MNESEHDKNMAELANDSEYQKWCDEREAETNESLVNMTDAEIEANFGLQSTVMTKVFVYGSLKRGFGNHSLLEHAKYLGNTETVNCAYKMHPLFGSFPAVTACTNDGYSIIGELYEVDEQTLQSLDMLEGNGSMYTRYLTQVYDGPQVVEAWMYMMPVTSQLIVGSEVHRTDRYVYTDSRHNTQEWFKV